MFFITHCTRVRFPSDTNFDAILDMKRSQNYIINISRNIYCNNWLRGWHYSHCIVYTVRFHLCQLYYTALLKHPQPGHHDDQRNLGCLGRTGVTKDRCVLKEVLVNARDCRRAFLGSLTFLFIEVIEKYHCYCWKLTSENSDLRRENICLAILFFSYYHNSIIDKLFQFITR